MARNTWQVEVLGSGNVWSNNSTIYRPNDNLSVDLTSTQSKISLADGSEAFLGPENKFTRDTISFIWLEILEGDSLRTTIEGYVQNQDYLRITTHLGEQLIGRFTNVRRIWLRGVEDTYDLQASFLRIE